MKEKYIEIFNELKYLFPHSKKIDIKITTNENDKNMFSNKLIRDLDNTFIVNSIDPLERITTFKYGPVNATIKLV